MLKKTLCLLLLLTLNFTFAVAGSMAVTDNLLVNDDLSAYSEEIDAGEFAIRVTGYFKAAATAQIAIQFIDSDGDVLGSTADRPSSRNWTFSANFATAPKDTVAVQFLFIFHVYEGRI